MREINATAILQLLRGEDWQPTLSQMANATGLSRPTLEAGLLTLVERGWAAEVQPSEKRAKSGRPARRFRFVDENGCVEGIDVGPNKVDFLVLDLRGAVLARQQVAISTAVDLTTQYVAQLLIDLLETNQLSHRQLFTVKVGVPGVVDSSGELTNSFVMPHWANSGIADQFAKALGKTVTLENDANLATITEHRTGAGRGHESMIYLMVGTRIGAGILVNNQLLRGNQGSAGELGSLPLDKWPDSREALVTELRGNAAHKTDAELVSEVFRLAENRVPLAVEQVRRYTRGLSRAVIALLLSVDPAILVVGGGTAQTGETLLGPLREELAAIALVDIPVVLADNVMDAVVKGAASLALEETVNTVLLRK